MAVDAQFVDPPEPISALHARMSAPLRRFFRSYRLNAADIDDLTQDVFVRLAQPGGQARLLNPEAFVFTLARNLVRDRARRLYTKAISQSIAAGEAQLSCGRPTPDRWLELEQELEDVEAVLASLKPTAREAFILHRVQGESYAAIAAQLNISISMVEKHIMSAMQALRTGLAVVERLESIARDTLRPIEIARVVRRRAFQTGAHTARTPSAMTSGMAAP